MVATPSCRVVGAGARGDPPVIINLWLLAAVCEHKPVPAVIH